MYMLTWFLVDKTHAPKFQMQQTQIPSITQPHGLFRRVASAETSLKALFVPGIIPKGSVDRRMHFGGKTITSKCSRSSTA